MHQMNIDSLANGQKTWSNQAAELQVLRADHENRKKQGQGFFKMDEASIIKVREELANDICELITQHTEEIYKNSKTNKQQWQCSLMSMKKNVVDKKANKRTRVQGSEKEESGSFVPLNESHQEEARSDAQQEEVESTQQPNHGQHSQEQAALMDTEAQEEEESNLFNILNEDVSDIGEDY